ncbi:uncharacterized protein LOC131157613 [Malania oleifera]|uniref:uncharacterized protein LOC131157613 n=1 Tax=Malania oleifera TaxID=397392 RepID=UPI0025AE85C1|nr:uncharacterized protein LOC131157613 [Malania oleifera]
MLLRKTICKTRNFLHKTLKNLESLIIGEYQKLPKTPPFNPFSCSRSSSLKIHQLDHVYADVSSQGESDQDIARTRKKKKKRIMSSDEPMKDEDSCNESHMKSGKQPLVQNKQKEKGDKKKSKGISTKEGKRGEPSCKNANGGAYVLAQKMKELEKMDGGDLNHGLDIEEVLHYYSLLKSPVYLDIVDNFFTDMYSDFFHPRTSGSTRHSQRKLGPVKL